VTQIKVHLCGLSNGNKQCQANKYQELQPLVSTFIITTSYRVQKTMHAPMMTVKLTSSNIEVHVFHLIMRCIFLFEKG